MARKPGKSTRGGAGAQGKKGGGKKGKRQGKRQRDYKAEYRKRIARALKLGLPASVGRGHPRRERGEVGVREARELRLAVKTPSPGEARRAGVRVSAGERERRREARRALGKMLEGMGIEIPSARAAKRDARALQFAELFAELGLGTSHEAYTLYFSP